MNTARTSASAVPASKKQSANSAQQQSEGIAGIAPERPTILDVHRKPGQVLADFMTFVREQGVIGLSIAVVLGGAVTRLVQALVADIINPVIGILLGAAGDLASMKLKIGPVEFLWGHFAATLIDFIIVASVIYLLVRLLKLDKIDKKKA